MKLQIIPDYNIDNKKVIGLVENIHNHKNIFKRMRWSKEEDGLEIKGQKIITYEILITNNNVNFYLGFDEELAINIETELNVCWPNATFKEVKPILLHGSIKELELAEHYFLSLKTDLRGEFPLSNILETQKTLREGEKILVRFELTPISPSWYREAEECIKNFEKGKMTTKTAFKASDLGVKAIGTTLEVIYGAMDFVNSIVSDETIEHEYINNNKYNKLFRNGLSSDTKDKPRYNAYNVKTLITVASERPEILFRNIYKSFNSMAGDNQFILVDYSKYKNILCSRELAQIMQLPTKTYQELYQINNIDNREVIIPNELLKTGIPIGTATLKGKQIDTYFSNNINIRALPKIVIGPQNAGKTTFTTKFTVSSHNIGDSNIVIDYIQDCGLSKDIEKHLPYNDTVVIDVSDEKNICALAYNEAYKLIENGDSWQRLKIANLLANQMEYLINSINVTNTNELTPRMLRYLYAACMVVFIHYNKTVDDVFQVLRKWQVRNEYLREARYSGCFADDDEVFYDLNELHDRDSKDKIVGTKENLISGILDRITILSKNIYIKAMLKADTNYKIDFIEYIEEGKTVLVRIPQTVFPDPQVRDTLATYFMTRIWLAVQLRKQHSSNRLCHIVVDEVHQIPTCASFIKNHITEFRRHRLGTLFTVHYLKQFGKLLNAVKSAGSSYLILAGTEKENIKTLEDEIKPFTVDEAMNLKPYHSLNIVNYGNQYTRYISKLPKPLSN